MKISILCLTISALFSSTIFAEASCERIAKDEEKLWGLGEQSQLKIQTEQTKIFAEKEELEQIEEDLAALRHKATGGLKINDPLRKSDEFQQRMEKYLASDDRHLLIERKLDLLQSIYTDQDLNNLANQGHQVFNVTKKVNTKSGAEARYYYGENNQLIAVSYLKPHERQTHPKAKRGRRQMLLFTENCSKVGNILDSENFSFEEGSEHYNLYLDTQTCKFFSHEEVVKAAANTQGWRHKRATRCTVAEGLYDSKFNSCYCENNYPGTDTFLVPHYDFNFSNCSGKFIKHKDDYNKVNEIGKKLGVGSDNYPEISSLVFNKAKKNCDKFSKAGVFHEVQRNSASSKENQKSTSSQNAE